MRLNNWSIAAWYDTARIFVGLGFGSSTTSRSIISRPRRTGLCSGSTDRCRLAMPVKFDSGLIAASWS